jgi:Hemerythrin HHE cation binding domain
VLAEDRHKEVPMQTETQPLRDEHRDFSDPLDVIRQVADGVDGLSLPELRRQINALHAFLVDRFIPHVRADEEAVDPLIERVLDAHSATEPIVGESAEVSRLAGKLLALRERLLFSYFGPAQLRSLQNVPGPHSQANNRGRGERDVARGRSR